MMTRSTIIIKDDNFSHNPLHNPLPSDIPVSREGFDLLGCPIGSPASCASSALKKVKKVHEIICLLPALKDSQMEATLLCMCLALPKLSFFLWTCPPIYVREAITWFDLAIFEAISDLVGGSLSDWSWLKVSLPILLGGLGT